jgi:hypothetical protein
LAREEYNAILKYFVKNTENGMLKELALYNICACFAVFVKKLIIVSVLLPITESIGSPSI